VAGDIVPPRRSKLRAMVPSSQPQREPAPAVPVPATDAVPAAAPAASPPGGMAGAPEGALGRRAMWVGAVAVAAAVAFGRGRCPAGGGGGGAERRGGARDDGERGLPGAAPRRHSLSRQAGALLRRRGGGVRGLRPLGVGGAPAAARLRPGDRAADRRICPPP